MSKCVYVLCACYECVHVFACVCMYMFMYMGACVCMCMCMCVHTWVSNSLALVWAIWTDYRLKVDLSC